MADQEESKKEKELRETTSFLATHMFLEDEGAIDQIKVLDGFFKFFGINSDEMMQDVTEQDIINSPVFQRELSSKGVDYDDVRGRSLASDSSASFDTVEYGVSRGVFSYDDTADAAFRAALNIGIERHVENSIARGVGYEMGAKGNGSTVDCSGLVQASVQDAMNATLDDRDRGLTRIFATHSDGQLSAVSRRTGIMLTGSDVNTSNLKAGMVIGIDSGDKGWDSGRDYGIDHVGIVYTDTETGNMMFAESRGGRGVMATPLDEWLEYAGGRGYRLYASDVTELASDAQKQEVAQKVLANSDIEDNAADMGVDTVSDAGGTDVNASADDEVTQNKPQAPDGVRVRVD